MHDSQLARSHQFEELAHHAPRILGSRTCCHCGHPVGIRVEQDLVIADPETTRAQLSRGQLLAAPYRSSAAPAPEWVIRNALFSGNYSQGFIKCGICECYSFWSTCFAQTIPTDRSDEELEHQFDPIHGYQRSRSPRCPPITSVDRSS